MIFVGRDLNKALIRYLENRFVEILINTLGYKVLVPAPKATDDTVYLYCKGSGASATGFVSIGGFTVL